MQNFITTRTVYICKHLLLHLPNTYAELCCYTYLLGKAMSVIVFKRAHTITVQTFIFFIPTYLLLDYRNEFIYYKVCISKEEYVLKTYRVGMARNKIIDQTIRKRILLALLQSCGDACGRIFVQRMGYYRCHLQSARPHPAERESLVAISVRSPQYHLPKATPPTHYSVSIRMACNCNTFTYIHTSSIVIKCYCYCY